MKLTIPMRLPSRSNLERSHWTRHKLVTEQRALVSLFLNRSVGGSTLTGELSVLLVRVSPRPLDDDNLRGACKAPRDEIAEWLGLPDDRDPRVSWLYDQRRGAPGEHALEVTIGRRTTCEHCGAVRVEAA